MPSFLQFSHSLNSIHKSGAHLVRVMAFHLPGKIETINAPLEWKQSKTKISYCIKAQTFPLLASSIFTLTICHRLAHSILFARCIWDLCMANVSWRCEFAPVSLAQKHCNRNNASQCNKWSIRIFVHVEQMHAVEMGFDVKQIKCDRENEREGKTLQ